MKKEPSNAGNDQTQKTQTPRSTMSSEAQRIAIAEACGWEIPDHCMTKRLQRGESFRALKGACPDFGMKDGRAGDLPGYLSDLNAMHEAEKVVTRGIDTCLKYQRALSEVCGCDGYMEHAKFLWHATATQR